MKLARITSGLLSLSLLLGALSCTGSVPLGERGTGQNNLAGFINATATRSLDTMGGSRIIGVSAAFSASNEIVNNPDVNPNIETKNFGDCVVTVIPIGGFDTELPDQELPMVTGLDAGATGMVGNGTNMATLTQVQTGAYIGMGDLTNQGFATGQLLTFEFPGGADILAFLATILLPNEITINSPDLEDANFSISNNAALTITWSGAGGAIPVTVNIQSSEAQSFVQIACTFDDNGSATVPLAAMECLPDDPTTTSISITRTNTDEVTVNLVGGGTRVVRLAAQTGVSRSISAGFSFPGNGNGGDMEDFDACQFITCPDGQTCNPNTFACE